MNGILASQVFFIISSVGFVILWIFTAIFLFYLIRATHTFERILGKIEKDIDSIGDTTKDLIEDIKESFIFRFFFKKKRRHKSGDKGEK